MRNVFLITGHLIGPTTVELDEPVAGVGRTVEVMIRGEVPPAVPSVDDFWKERTIEELAAEQGVTVPQPVEMLIGQGADLWESDEEASAFFRDPAERRRGDPPHAP